MRVRAKITFVAILATNAMVTSGCRVEIIWVCGDCVGSSGFEGDGFADSAAAGVGFKLGVDVGFCVGVGVSRHSGKIKEVVNG